MRKARYDELTDLKRKTKRYKGALLEKFSDGRVGINTKHSHKGSHTISKNHHFTIVGKDGFTAAKKKVDRWVKP